MQKNRILIIDDNPIDHMITSHVLRTVYKLWDVVVIESAQQALEFIELNKENISELPSLIILDLDMPGLNGIGFLERFALHSDEVKEACKIVVLTASDVAADLATMKANPDVIKLISKPLDKTALSSVIPS
jgi:CheY-like chemotaxis protein